MTPKCKLWMTGKIGVPVFFIFFVLFIAVAVEGSVASTLVVNGTSIQEAVDMANDGDEIIVYSGTYRENIVVDKSVCIRSYGGASDTVVEAHDMKKSVFHITADYVNISGFTIRHGQEGIFLDEVNHTNISGNSIKKNYNDGIYLYFSDRNIIENNNISDNTRNIHNFLSFNNVIDNNIILDSTYGMFLDISIDNIITNNNISNTEYGIYLVGDIIDNLPIPSMSTTISNNNISNNEHGISFYLSINNTLKNNNISNNRDGINMTLSLYNDIKNNTILYNEVGIKLDSSYNNTIDGNIASNNYGIMGSSGSIFGGIVLTSSSNNTIKNNIANSNSEDGISLYSSSNDNNVTKNIASNNKYGIFISSSLNNSIKRNVANSNKEEGIGLRSSSNNTIEKNIVSQDGYGISLLSSSHNTIKSSIANSNSKYGIFLDLSDSNKIEKNIASNNYGGSGYGGIYLIRSSNNSITENIANSNSKQGIRLSSSCNNILKNNNVSINDCGISLSNSTNNRVYHNNIIDNYVIPAEDDNSEENDWHNPISLEGNYWADYEGIDDGSGWGNHSISGDGIGDTKDTFPHYNDYYPYVNKDGWLTFLVSPEYWDFGTVYQGRSKNAPFEIQNKGVHDLTILSISADPNIVISGIEPSMKIPRGSSKAFNVTIDTTNLEGDVLRSVEITTDDKIAHNKTILIYGFVKPPVHDVRITDIDFDSRVIKGQIDVFNVSISNYGSFEEHNLTVEFKDGTDVIGTVPIPELLAGKNETVSYNWDTKDVAAGVHKIAIEIRFPNKDLLDSIGVKVNVLPASEASTLIITNFNRLSELWGEENKTRVEAKLIELSYSPCVNGIIVNVCEDINCSDAYKSWKEDILNPEEANKVSEEIKQVIVSKLEEYRSVKYIILVGDDRVIPFYRLTDNSNESYVGDPLWWRTEDQYVSKDECDLSGKTSISSALKKNKYFTDDFYADFIPEDVPEGVELYIPEKPIGRLIETPDEISSTIDAFLKRESISPDKIFITGYDFMNDSSRRCADILKKLKPANITIMSKGDEGTANYNNASDIIDELLKKRNDVIAIFLHAEHTYFQIPPGRADKRYDYITSEKILDSPANLSGAIVYTMSCHAGLNVPDDETNSKDLAQSFVNKKVLAYVSPTGYGMGCTVSVAGHERLLTYFSGYLCKGNDVGTSLLLAKQDYYLHDFHFDSIDEKVIASMVLYGLPMYRVKAEAEREVKALSEDLPMNYEKIEQSGELEIATLTLRPGGIAKDYLLSSGKPILPKAAWPYTITEKEMIHGITLKNARYDVEENAKVTLGTFTVSAAAEEQNEFKATNWYPPKLLKVNTIVDKQEMVIITGQYCPYYLQDYTRGDLREFTELTFDIYISSPEKEKDPPEIAVKPEGSDFIIKAWDNESGIFKVIVAYTNTTKDKEKKRGEWMIREYDGGGNSYCTCTFAVEEGVEFFVQAVDNAGNVAVDNNDGEYYPEKE